MKTVALLALSLLGTHLEWRLKRITGGLALFLASLAVAILGIFAALAGLFFALADKHTLVSPSLITALIALLIAALLGLEGTRLMHKKRR